MPDATAPPSMARRMASSAGSWKTTKGCCRSPSCRARRSTTGTGFTRRRSNSAPFQGRDWGGRRMARLDAAKGASLRPLRPLASPHSQASPLKGRGKLDPRRRVVAGLLLTARPFVDAGAAQPVGGFGRAEQMVEAKAKVALPAARGVVPEGVELLFVRVQRAQRVGPALVQDPAPGRPRLGLHHRVVLGR